MEWIDQYGRFKVSQNLLKQQLNVLVVESLDSVKFPSRNNCISDIVLKKVENLQTITNSWEQMASITFLWRMLKSLLFSFKHSLYIYIWYRVGSPEPSSVIKNNLRTNKNKPQETTSTQEMMNRLVQSARYVTPCNPWSSITWWGI